MHFSFTEDQLLFRDTVRDILSNESAPEAVRAAWEGPTGRIDGLWGLLAETGVIGLTAPESAGGLGMNEIDLVLLLEEAGYSATPEPLIEHVAVGVPTLATAGQADLLASAANGEALVTVAAPYALYADQASHLLLLDDDAVRLGPADELDLTPQASIDGTRRLFAVDAPAGWGEEVDVDPQLMRDRGALAAAAQCVGVARRLLDTTVAYVSERYQFGKPVGTYQAVKHHLANVGLAIEFAGPAVYQAAHEIATGGPAASRDVSMAKVLASDAVDLAAKQALQCHGAIGYTYEYDLQLWLKRAWALSAAWGDSSLHRNRVGEALGI